MAWIRFTVESNGRGLPRIASYEADCPDGHVEQYQGVISRLTLDVFAACGLEVERALLYALGEIEDHFGTSDREEAGRAIAASSRMLRSVMKFTAVVLNVGDWMVGYPGERAQLVAALVGAEINGVRLANVPDDLRREIDATHKEQYGDLPDHRQAEISARERLASSEPPLPSTPPDGAGGRTPIRTLGLSSRAENAIHNLSSLRNMPEFTTAEELTGVSERDLLSVRNCGETTVDEIREKMQRVGLSLKGELASSGN